MSKPWYRITTRTDNGARLLLEGPGFTVEQAEQRIREVQQQAIDRLADYEDLEAAGELHPDKRRKELTKCRDDCSKCLCGKCSNRSCVRITFCCQPYFRTESLTSCASYYKRGETE